METYDVRVTRQGDLAVCARRTVRAVTPTSAMMIVDKEFSGKKDKWRLECYQNDKWCGSMLPAL